MKIAAAISGGVDSIRAAVLLREEGHEVFGIHMRCLPCPGEPGEVHRIVDERERPLRQLAARCQIPIVIIDLREQFDTLVVRPFVEAYMHGLTPNPCIECNPRVKFGLLLDEAIKLGAERMATGHYARLNPPAHTNQNFQLRRGKDPAKDQSYFLMGLNQQQLARVLFPLGEHTKQQTLAWAEQAGIKPLLTEESQEICFIASGDYTDFVRKRHRGEGPAQSGPILDLSGNLLGRHNGIHSYTVGQRRGLGIPSTAPYYVIRIEPESNVVRIGRSKDLFCEMFAVSRVNWISIDRPDEPITCEVRIRNLHRPAQAEVTPLGDAAALVRFFEPQRAVTPGQAAVFYSGDLLLGGGIIDRHS
ncbi:MAG: tRNA 2-thiouridine(34) synthase MnmA [Syntrophobacteraceae bacterium]